jgi:hypothetical protein
MVAGPDELEIGTTWPKSYAAGQLDRILQRHAEAARMRNNSNAEASFNTFNTSEKCNLRRQAGECKYALTESPALAPSLARAAKRNVCSAIIYGDRRRACQRRYAPTHLYSTATS